MLRRPTFLFLVVLVSCAPPSQEISVLRLVDIFGEATVDGGGGNDSLAPEQRAGYGYGRLAPSAENGIKQVAGAFGSPGLGAAGTFLAKAGSKNAYVVRLD